MATTTGAGIDRPLPASAGAQPFAAVIDRWIYVIMAVLILTVVLVGFIPDSIMMLQRIEAGAESPIPPILHVHAVLMGSWILLLLAQATLMATGRRGHHTQLGMIAAMLVPAIVVAGFVLVPVRHQQLHADIAAAPPDVAGFLQSEIVPLATNVMLAQIRIGIIFPLLVGVALYLRRPDPETHKRLMILATVSALPAATDRMTFLPTTLPDSPLTMDVYMLMIALPLILWDLYRGRLIQRAYVVWLALVIPSAIAMNALWGTAWWQSVGPQLVGTR